MSYETRFGKNAEAAQAMFIDSIFAIEDTFNRKDAITLLADFALERIPKEMAMHSIVKEIRDRYNDPFLPAPTIKQLDAFKSFLKHYKSRDILTDYQLRIIQTNNTPTPKTDIERQVDDLKERVAKLEAIINMFAGAKGQDEKVYSKEEVISLLDFVNERLPDLYSRFSSEEEFDEWIRNKLNNTK